MSGLTVGKTVRGWAIIFQLGLFDPFMLFNFDKSAKRAFDSLGLDKDDAMLDVGSGNGRMQLHAQSWLRSGGEMYGVEISPEGIRAAELRAERLGIRDRVRYFLGDMCAASDVVVPTRPIGGAVAHFSLPTLPSETDRRRVVSELGKLIRPGGRVALVVPSESYNTADVLADARRAEDERTDLSAWQRTLRKRVIYWFSAFAVRGIERSLNDGTFHRYSVDELTKHLTEAGFESIDVARTYGGCAYRAVGRRAA